MAKLILPPKGKRVLTKKRANSIKIANSRMDNQMDIFKRERSVPDDVKKTVKIKNLKKGNWYAGMA
jgi:hypothetical protein